MRGPPSPFIWHAGHAYLVVNFDPAPSDLPSLEEILARLLTHYRPAEILVLRPLTRSETRLLEQSNVERDREVWAQIVARDEERYRGR